MIRVGSNHGQVGSDSLNICCLNESEGVQDGVETTKGRERNRARHVKPGSMLVCKQYRTLTGASPASGIKVAGIPADFFCHTEIHSKEQTAYFKTKE